VGYKGLKLASMVKKDYNIITFSNFFNFFIGAAKKKSTQHPAPAPTPAPAPSPSNQRLRAKPLFG
jgi:hypothetical protein